MSLTSLRISLITILLWTCNAALLAAIGFAFVGDSQTGISQQTPVASDTGGANDLDIPIPARNVDAIQSQALFHASRSFYIPAEPESVTAPAPDYRFTGAMGTPNKPLMGLLVHNQTNAKVKVSANDQLEGWQVEEVTARYVVVTLNGQRHEISSVRTPGLVNNNLASNAGSASGGLSVVPAGQAAPQKPTGGNIRVLSDDKKMISPSTPVQASGEQAPRLYRPPQ